MADEHHEHGKMDITEQERTFEGFMKIVTWSGVGIVVALILLYAING